MIEMMKSFSRSISFRGLLFQYGRYLLISLFKTCNSGSKPAGDMEQGYRTSIGQQANEVVAALPCVKKVSVTMSAQPARPVYTEQLPMGLQTISNIVAVSGCKRIRLSDRKKMCKLYFSRRAALAEELTLLKQVDQFSFDGLSPGRGEDCSRVPPMSPNARLARTTSLENMLSSSSDALVSIPSQLSEAEQRERSSSGHRRWNLLQSMGDAKKIASIYV